jgi:hypothetical protein
MQGQHHSTYLFFLDILFPVIFCEYISIRYKRKGKEALNDKKLSMPIELIME